MTKMCDICKEQGNETVAVYDAKTIYGPWAFLCDSHYAKIGVKVKGLFTVLKIGKN